MSTVTNLGFYANALLLGPVGLDAAYATPVWLVGREATALLDTASRLVDALKADGYNTEGLKIPLIDARALRGDPIFRRQGFTDLAEALRNVEPGTFRRAADQVIETSETPMACSLNGRAAKWSKNIFQNPRRTWSWYSGRPYDYRGYALRLEFAGRHDEARRYWRMQGVSNVMEGRRLSMLAENATERHQNDFSEFLMEVAISTFVSAANAFERAGSDVNRVKALTAMKVAQKTLEESRSKSRTEEPRRITILEMLGELKLDAEQEPDHELVHYARYAAIGDEDGMQTFLRKASEILDVSPDAILDALANPQEDPIDRVMSRVVDGAEKLLGVNLDTIIDPLEAGFTGETPKNPADINGVGLFGRLQNVIGRDNVILERLINAARRYKEGHR